MSAFSGRFAARNYKSGRTHSFIFADGKLREEAPTNEDTELVFGPSFCDIQANGFAGVDFNAPDVTLADCAEALGRLKETGCTVVLPTLITAEETSLIRGFEHLSRLPSRLSDGTCIPAFHLEGPFISPADGARGAHPLAAVRAPDPALWRRLQNAASGKIRMVTLAPETPGAIGFISQLRKEKVIPALGHCMATAEDITAAASAGAVLSTHLGNGCPALLDRHRNPVLAQLAEDRLGASYIPDGIHLPQAAFQSFWRAKQGGPRILTTDCMSAAWAPPGRYTIGSVSTEVGADGVVRLPGTTAFAGSALTMNRAVPLAARLAGIPLSEAWDAASIVPLGLLETHCGIKIPPATVFANVHTDRLEVTGILHGRNLWSPAP
jgi:N-acetylglucosamine-6-phosphate deacetylase